VVALKRGIQIDGFTMITGSFEFAKGAEDDKAENLPVIGDKPSAMLDPGLRVDLLAGSH
jgi:hypothetical protein